MKIIITCIMLILIGDHSSIKGNPINCFKKKNVNATLISHTEKPIGKSKHRCTKSTVGIQYHCNTSQILNAPSGNYKFIVELDSSLHSKFLQKLECTAIDDSANGKFVQNTFDQFLQLSTVNTVGKIQYPQNVIVAFCID